LIVGRVSRRHAVLSLILFYVTSIGKFSSGFAATRSRLTGRPNRRNYGREFVEKGELQAERVIAFA
jgi:hypothetical protein